MKYSEYRQQDATGLAELIRRGEVSPEELLNVALQRAHDVRSLNGLVHTCEDLARQRTRQRLSGPFAGVPFLTKDLGQEVAGLPTSLGSRPLKKNPRPATVHSELTQRWLDAGLVIFGRTNTPEFGIKPVTEPQAWGASRNPWHPKHTPGGSSGGSAALVAAGVVPMAGANDGGGSIRIPAAYCGLFGLKPGRGRTPWGPPYSELMFGAAVNHVVTRSVRDSAALLDASHGPELGALFHLAPPERPYLDEVSRDPGRLRIGYTTQSPLGTSVDLEAVRAVEKTVQLLRQLGHEVEEASPRLDAEALAQDFLRVWYGNAAACMQEVMAETGCKASDFELETRALAEFGHALTAHEAFSAQRRWQQHALALAQFHQHHHLWLSPTTAGPAPKIGAMALNVFERSAIRTMLATGTARRILDSGLARKMSYDTLQYVPFTQLANVTGTPAMSVPLHVSSKGLPIGVQFVAPPGGEGLLFQLAGQLEQAQPWPGLAPMALK